ncbi:MAG: TolC family protein [Candidatus Omnitrophica bacterium]|nr:TolC family protein [Candidatus Omnitrophota bacterium]
MDGAAPLALPELLEEVRRVNPDLAAARKRWEAAQQRIPLSKGLPAPRIGVEFEEIPRGTVKLNQATILYSLVQSLPFPGKLSLKAQVAVKEAQVAGAIFKQQEWEVLNQLKSGYYDLFLLDRELEIQREQALLLEQAEATARARYASGGLSQPELLQVQSERLSAQNELEVLAHRRLAMSAHLNHLLSRPAGAEMGSPGPLRLLAVPSGPEELLAKALESQPELLAFRYSAERAQAAWKLSKRELWPDLETMLELRDPAMGPIGPWDLTLALVLPFWFWTKQKYGVRAALYDKESAEAAYQGVRNEIARRVHEHWHEAQAAHATAKLCKDGLIGLARQRVSSLLASYRAGATPFQDLSEAQRELNERQRTYYRHLVQLEQHLILLEQAVGIPLREEHEPAESTRGAP